MLAKKFPEHTLLWRVAWPILISLVLEHMINLTDTVFLGRVGEIELGASAVAGVFYLALFMLAYGFSNGLQILIGRRNGEARFDEIGPLLMQGIMFITTVGLGVVGLTFFFGPPLLRALISSPEIADAAIMYIDWRIIGLVFAGVSFMFRSFYVGITQTRLLTLNSLIMVSSNVVMNYALIFGEFGMPRMGIAGAALASSLSEMISMLFFILHVRFCVDRKKYGFNRSAFLAFHQVPPMIRLSVWTMAQHFVGISVWFVFFVAVEHLGSRSIAISTMVRSFGSFMFMPVLGFSSAVSTLVSNQIGSGESHKVLATCRRGVIMCYLFLSPVFLFVALYPEVILRAFTDNQELVKAAVPSLWVIVSSYVLAIPACVFFNAVSGTGNTRHAMLIDFVAFFVYSAYVYVVIFHFKVDVAVAWTAEHTYWLPLLALAIPYMIKGKWKNKKI